jgi:hypothetical protein
MEEMWTKCNKTEFAFFAGIAWRIWLRRNELLHGGTFLHPNIILKHSAWVVEEQLTLEEKLILPTEPLEDRATVRWKAPPLGFLKVNWDANNDSKRGRMGVGVIVQDHPGRMWASKCMVREGFLDPMSAEAMGATMVAHFCRDLGMERIQLEGTPKLSLILLILGDKMIIVRGIL